MKGMNKNEIQIIKHTLGLDYKKEPFRNHFVTGEGTVDFPICEGLVERGFMIKREHSLLSTGDFVYYVTEEGKKAIKAI